MSSTQQNSPSWVYSEVKAPAPGAPATPIVTQQKLVTSGSVVLTSNPAVAGALLLVPTADVVIQADTVEIFGKIRLPGRNVTIVCRELRTAKATTADGQPEFPGIQVDGTDGVEGQPLAKAAAADGTDGAAGTGSAGGGADQHPEMNGLAGNPGQPGTPGGEIRIFCDHWLDDEKSGLVLSARGGKGGSGSAGQNGGKGGNGGDGRDAAITDTGKQVEYGLLSTLGINGLAKAISGKRLVDYLTPGTAGGNGGKGGNAGNGGDAFGGAAGGAVIFCCAQQRPELMKTLPASSNTMNFAGAFFSSENAKERLRLFYSTERGADGTPGEPGNPGWGGEFGTGGRGAKSKYFDGESIPSQPDGKPGDRGQEGKRGVLQSADAPPYGPSRIVAGSWPDADTLIDPAFPRMLLRRARRAFLASTDGGKPDMLDIAQQLAEFTLSMPAVSRDVAAGAKRLLTSLLVGGTYFGKTASWVPRTALGKLQTDVQQSLGWLQTLQPLYASWSRELQDSVDSRESLRQCLAQNEADVQALEDEVTDTQGWLNGLLKQLDDGKAELDAARSTLRTAMDDFKAALSEDKFELQPDQLMDGLEQMVFTEGNPVMGAVEGGKIFIGGTTEITGDDGDVVKKAYVISGIRKLDRGLNSFGQIWEAADGQLATADSGGRKLALAQEDFDALCDKLYAKLGEARAAEDAMDAFVDCVSRRNDLILAYNDGLSQLADLRHQQDQARLQHDALQGQLAQSTAVEARLVPEVTYVQALYDKAVDRALSNLYRAGRAVEFWSLGRCNLIADILGGADPGKVGASEIARAWDRDADSTTVGSGLAGLRRRLADAVEKLGQPPQPLASSPRSVGACIRYAEKNHPALIRQLREKGVACIRIQPPGPDTTSAFNPFVGKADVRLTIARAWLIGAAPKAIKGADGRVRQTVTVILSHLGDELLIDTAGKPHRFQHQGVKLTFTYDAAAAATLPDAKAVLVAEGGVDGTLGHPAGTEPGLYAEVGPFAAWRIEVPKNQNQGIDLSKLEAVIFEFHGGFRTAGSA